MQEMCCTWKLWSSRGYAPQSPSEPYERRPRGDRGNRLRLVDSASEAFRTRLPIDGGTSTATAAVAKRRLTHNGRGTAIGTLTGTDGAPSRLTSTLVTKGRHAVCGLWRCASRRRSAAGDSDGDRGGRVAGRAEAGATDADQIARTRFALASLAKASITGGHRDHIRPYRAGLRCDHAGRGAAGRAPSTPNSPPSCCCIGLKRRHQH
jgi:hypothetical protein